uniref:Uncharacterized protein n=1 Tax=viral metagenome TaxID=1070528 RepID=A0A6C0HRP8_9ZZZZ
MSSFADPTETIDSLISKLSLSLLLLASAILFYEISNRKLSKIPKASIVTLTMILLVLSVAVSICSTYEFYTVIPEYKNCKQNCLYSEQTLWNISVFYCSFATIFILTILYIGYLLLKYY